MAALAVACQSAAEPLDPPKDSQRAAQQAGDVLRASAAAARGNDKLPNALSDVAAGFDTASGTASGVGTSSPTPPPPPPPPGPRNAGPGVLGVLRGFSALGRLPGLREMTAARPRPVAELDPAGLIYAPDDMDLARQLEDFAEEVERTLRARVMADANIETRSDSEVVYLLKPDPTCRDPKTQQLDGDCAADLAKLQVRVRMTREDSGIKCDLLIGAERARPLTVYIREGHLALDGYLDGLRKSLEATDRAFNQRKADDLPAVMKGTLRLALDKTGPKAISSSLGIVDMLDVQNNGPRVAPRDRFAFRSAKSERVFSFSADGAAGTISAAYNLGATEVVMPFVPEDAAPPKGDVRVVLGGLTGATSFAQGREEIKLTKLGLGAGSTFVEIRGQRVFQLDLNERDARAFDATIVLGPDRTPRVTLSPRFDLALAFKLMAVASDFRDPPPSYLLDEVYRVVFDPAGSAPAFEPFEAPPPLGSFEPVEGLRVVSGKLSISAEKAGKSVSATAGQCLRGVKPAPGAHPVIGALAAGACP